MRFTRFALAALVTLAGCHTPADPISVTTFLFVRNRTAPDAPAGAANPPLVRADPGGMTVRGLLSTGTACQDFLASSVLAGTTVTLTVQAATQPVPCAQVIGAFAYSASLSGFSPGRYRVLTRHVYNGVDTARAPVGDTSVTVSSGG